MVVYGLYDASGELRYVGQTTKTPEKRLQEHLQPSSLVKSGHKNNWLRSMLDSGIRPYTDVICSTDNVEDMNNAERYWISYFRQAGCRLVNDVDGGEGLRNPSLETRAKMSAAKLGKPSNRLGIPVSESAKNKLRLANLGKKLSEITRSKMSLAHRQYSTGEALERLKTSKREWARKNRNEGV
jgi:hypothetical protein